MAEPTDQGRRSPPKTRAMLIEVSLFPEHQGDTVLSANYHAIDYYNDPDGWGGNASCRIHGPEHPLMGSLMRLRDEVNGWIRRYVPGSEWNQLELTVEFGTPYRADRVWFEWTAYGPDLRPDVPVVPAMFLKVQAGISAHPQDYEEVACYVDQLFTDRRGGLDPNPARRPKEWTTKEPAHALDEVLRRLEARGQVPRARLRLGDDEVSGPRLQALMSEMGLTYQGGSAWLFSLIKRDLFEKFPALFDGPEGD
jgi:hypothetical protein